MSSCSDRQYFAQTLRSVAFPYASIPLSGSRARPQQRYMYLEARQYKAGTRAKQRVLGWPGQACILSWAPTKSWVAGAWQMVTNPRLAGQWGIGHSRDVATRSRLSRLDRRSLCGPPDPRPGPAASEISQLRYSGGLQSIKNGTNDQKLPTLAGRPTHLGASQSAHLSSPAPPRRSKD